MGKGGLVVDCTACISFLPLLGSGLALVVKVSFLAASCPSGLQRLCAGGGSEGLQGD